MTWIAIGGALTYLALILAELVGIGRALVRIAGALEGEHGKGSDWYGKGLNGIAKAIRERPLGPR
jgi:hypothetical protein